MENGAHDRQWDRGGRALALMAALLLVAGVLTAPTAAQAAPGDVGVEAFSHSGTSTPTGTKRAESVLWFNDGFWWGNLWDTAHRGLPHLPVRCHGDGRGSTPGSPPRRGRTPTTTCCGTGRPCPSRATCSWRRRAGRVRIPEHAAPVQLQHHHQHVHAAEPLDADQQHEDRDAGHRQGHARAGSGPPGSRATRSSSTAPDTDGSDVGHPLRAPRRGRVAWTTPPP